MPTILAQLDQMFRNAIREALGAEGSASAMECDALVGISQNEKFGDYQSNVAMALAKALGEKTGGKPAPRAIAERIKSKLNLSAMASEVTIGGAGFINVRLSPDWLARQLNAIRSDSRLGIAPAAESQNVVVD